MLPSTGMSAAPQLAPAACSLAAVFIWGASDFAGGYASRRANAFVFTAVAHAFALALMLALALSQHAPFPSQASVRWALLAGGIGGFSLAIFYRALAEGKMGLTAPIAALLGAAIPTLADIAMEGAPRPWTFVGFALAIVAIWLITRAEPAKAEAAKGAAIEHPQVSTMASRQEMRNGTQDEARSQAEEAAQESHEDEFDDEEKTGLPPKGVAVAALAGVGFAAFYLCIRQAGAGSPLWIAAVSRAASLIVTAVAVVVTKAPLRFDFPRAAMAAVAGSFDISGSALFIFASQHGRLDEAVVISSLYPAITVILARLILKEHFSRWRFVGLLAALAAVPMIAAG
jgi:drug/metabolite transporter (DMT)-like permease